MKFDFSTRNGELHNRGREGSEPGQFVTPHSLALDARGNLYVADPANNRVQVFDNDGTFKAQISNVGASWAICISPAAHRYL